MSPDTRPVLQVGLTGGIASGKTTVTELLAEHGAFTIDADRVAHELLDSDAAVYDAVVERFGREVLDERGRIDRGRLGGRIFRDADARAALNAIVHPRIREESARRIAAYQPSGHSPIVIFDAALLVETGAWRSYHRVIVVRCSEQTQLQRLVARDGLHVDEAQARIDAQAPLEEKLAVADYVVDTDGTLRETERQAERVWLGLLEEFARRFGAPGATTG